MTGGLVYSQRLLLVLVDRGVERKAAYDAVQRNAMDAWQGHGNFQELVKKDPFISRKLRVSEIQACLDPRVYIKHLPKVYRRVFGSIPTPQKPKFKAIHKKGRR